jgi:hypothetical protein
MNRIVSILGVFALAACNGPIGNQDSAENGVAEAPRPTTPPVGNQSANAALPDNRTALEEPNGPIDPRSTEAAGQVVQHYGALIEQKRFADAEMLWSSAQTAREFALQLKRYPEAHLEIGNPGESEGAAGSVYVTVPVIFYGDDVNGAEFRRQADVILRRVNDVPGSTEEQRRWHIERIAWNAP